VLEGERMPLVMLVTRRRADWVKVQLPTRPNLSEAWVRERDVRLRHNEWRLRIDLSAYRVYTYRGDRLISEHTIGVGKSVTPTPRGRYYLTDLVKPEDPDGLYGSYAFGLSAHSDVVTSFGTGNGQIGIHGTNDTSTLESRVSHGCIRVGNSVIESFARHLPLGTPVRITT
jgi:lipoprotein-anchoring transpeptidase ErfK/SrfK